MRPLHRLPIATILCLLMILSGCDESSSPTGPMMGPLFVQSSGSATQIEPNNGFRVQVRMDVRSGAETLSQALRSGAASGQVCLAGTCDGSSLSTVFSEGVCAGLPMIPATGADLGIAAAWMDGNTVGIDFCIENMSGQVTLETSVSDGLNRSNVIQTTCTPGGTCFSG